MYLSTPLFWTSSSWTELKAVRYRCRKGKYFPKRADIQRLAESREKALTVLEAAAILKVIANTYKKVDQGLQIAPMSGPGIDKSAKYLYEWREVKKVQEREERRKQTKRDGRIRVDSFARRSEPVGRDHGRRTGHAGQGV